MRGGAEEAGVEEAKVATVEAERVAAEAEAEKAKAEAVTAKAEAAMAQAEAEKSGAIDTSGVGNDVTATESVENMFDKDAQKGGARKKAKKPSSNYKKHFFKDSDITDDSDTTDSDSDFSSSELDW